MSGKDPISENTPIRIGLIIAFLGIFGGAVWWASSISTKLDAIILSQTALQTADTKQTAEIIALQDRVKSIELVGSPPVLNRLTIIEKRLDLFEQKAKSP
jgi:hypothetical protein